MVRVDKIWTKNQFNKGHCHKFFKEKESSDLTHISLNSLRRLRKLAKILESGPETFFANFLSKYLCFIVFYKNHLRRKDFC